MLTGCLFCVICDSSSFIPSYSNLICYDCSHIKHVCNLNLLYKLCTFENIYGKLLNLHVIKSTPPLECLHCLFVCNLLFKQISFRYIQTLHNDCSHIEDVHRRRRSKADFGLVLPFTPAPVRKIATTSSL